MYILLLNLIVQSSKNLKADITEYGVVFTQEESFMQSFTLSFLFSLQTTSFA